VTALPPWRRLLRGALEREGRSAAARLLQLATVGLKAFGAQQSPEPDMGVQQDLNRRASKNLASSTPSSGSAWSRPDPRRASHGDWLGADRQDGGVRRATGLPRRVINTPSPGRRFPPAGSTPGNGSGIGSRNCPFRLFNRHVQGSNQGARGFTGVSAPSIPADRLEVGLFLAGVTSGSSEAAAAIAQQKEATSKGEGGRDHAQGCFDQAGPGDGCRSGGGTGEMAFGAGQGFEQVALPLGKGQGEIDRRTGAALTATNTLWLQRRSVSCLTAKLICTLIPL